jgi:hypothetical protein
MAAFPKGVIGMNRLGQLIAVVAFAAFATTMGGCQRSLFTGSDSYTQSRIDRYWDGDSARETTQARERSSDMGFGFPTGMANQ